MIERIEAAKTELFDALREETEVDLYQPIRDRVLIYPIAEPAHERESGLWVPEEDKKWRSQVLAVGPGMLTDKGRVAPDVEPGDIVITGAWIGEPLNLDGEEYRLVRAGDILGVLAGDDGGN